ncbi:MAG TPA: MurR/RpiR family transcriptional regulator [Propionibacteriaceae bacterium]|nr:MurR/RpiR family transcriptional regulator [Propionibacteriaceae bacterium]
MDTTTTGGSFLNIGQRIDSRYRELSRQEQRAANFILDHLEDLAVYSATEVAQHSGVSKATVSRLFRHLGFTSSQEVRQHARMLRQQANTASVTAAPPEESLLQHHLRKEQANSARMVASLRDGKLDQVTRLIGTAREALVVGERSSYPLALHLQRQLAESRGRVRLAPQSGQALGEELVGLGARDVAVLIGFRNRPASFGRQIDTIAGRGVPCVLIADRSARRYADRVTHWLECPVESVSSLDSYAAAMSLLNLVAAGVLAGSPASGRTRMASITAIRTDLNELETTV